MKIWQISREYDGIVGAGGIKDVVCGISEALAEAGHEVSVFLPKYSFVDLSAASGANNVFSLEIPCAGGSFPVSFEEREIPTSDGSSAIRLVFVDAEIFREKRAIYTYTAEDEAENPDRKRGCGHFDAELQNVLFPLAAVHFAKAANRRPDVVQTHDAHTAMFAAFAKTIAPCQFDAAKIFLTMHNGEISYRQRFSSLESAELLTGLPREILQKSCVQGGVEPILIAASFASRLATVSPEYAAEILARNDEFSQKIAAFGLVGITNGISVEKYSTENTAASRLPFAFDAEKGDFAGKLRCRKQLFARIKSKSFDKIAVHGILEGDDTVLFVCHSRIVQQKGFSRLARAIRKICESEVNACFAVIGQGEPSLENELSSLAESHLGKFAFLNGYDDDIVRLVIASGDFAVIPSEFEPCCLVDFIAALFGTIPVAHSVGGLKKIIDGETGFLYENADDLESELISLAANFAADRTRFLRIAANAASQVKSRHSWRNVVKSSYLPLFSA